MPRIIETKAYQYEELSDEAKQKAREWYAGLVFNDSHDWEFVYSDAETVGALIGIEIARKSYRTVGGGSGTEPAIYFSGFWSQGDGACFEGSYSYKKGGLEALKKHIGGKSEGDKELIRIATALQDIQRKHFYGITAAMQHRGRYYHSGCMAVDVYGRDGYEIGGDVEEEVKQLMRDFADWIYRQLEKEHEYLTSDEAVEEAILANEYEFDEDGDRI